MAEMFSHDGDRPLCPAQSWVFPRQGEAPVPISPQQWRMGLLPDDDLCETVIGIPMS